MKVICINASKSIIINDCEYFPLKLVEGKIYNAVAEKKDEYGIDLYQIEEFVNESLPYGWDQHGFRCKSFFRPLDTDWIDEAIEKALNEEPELVNV